MNWYKLFYWISVADNFKGFVFAIAVFATVVMCLVFIIAAVTRMNAAESIGEWQEDDKLTKAKSWLNMCKFACKVFIPIFCVFWLIYILTPSKSDTIMIIAGGAVGQFITSDSSSKKIPAEITTFLRAKIQTLTAEAKEDLGIMDAKSQKIKDLENLTKEELIERLKTDTTLLK